MRIAVVTTSYPRTGDDDAGIFVQRLVEGFSEQGATGIVVVPSDSGNESVTSTGSFVVTRVRYGLFRKGRLAFGAGILPNLRSNPTLIFQAPGLVCGIFWKLYRDRSISLVHANWIISALPAYLLSCATEIPYLLTLRGEDVRLLRNPILRRLIRPSILRAAHCVTVSETLADEVSRLYPEIIRPTVIWNGVAAYHIDHAESKQFQKQKKLYGVSYLLFVGTVIPRKRVDLLIRLISEKPLHSFTLVICGRIDDKAEIFRLHALIAELNCADRVRFEGAVPPEEIGHYLHGAKCYLSASEFEGRPNAALEAMAAGRAVFLSSIEAHREIVGAEERGLLFEAEDLHGSAQKLASLLSDASQREPLIERGLTFTRQLSWSQSASRYLSLFRSIARTST